MKKLLCVATVVYVLQAVAGALASDVATDTVSTLVDNRTQQIEMYTK